MNLNEAQQALVELSDEQVRASNITRGDPYSVNLSQLRALAKSITTDHPLAIALWRSGDVDARLLATLVCKPKAFSADELDEMLREVRAPKVHDWFVSFVVKSSKHAEALRLRWQDSPDPEVGRAGWILTTARVAKSPEGLDLPGLLDQIEAEMKAAPARKQWSMNHCLAEIGIRNAALRARAMDIGERLQVLADYPASPGCTPPFAPVWIAEMVRRSES